MSFERLPAIATNHNAEVQRLEVTPPAGWLFIDRSVGPNGPNAKDYFTTMQFAVGTPQPLPADTPGQYVNVTLIPRLTPMSASSMLRADVQFKNRTVHLVRRLSDEADYQSDYGTKMIEFKLDSIVVWITGQAVDFSTLRAFRSGLHPSSLEGRK